MISEEALEVWLSLAQDTGDGPWDYDSHDRYFHVFDAKSWLVAQCEDRSDAAFIAAAREAVPMLIAEVRRLKKERTDAIAKAGTYEDFYKEAVRKLSCFDKEADWLAEQGSDYGCPTQDVAKVCQITNCVGEVKIKCWRDAARKAVEE